MVNFTDSAFLLIVGFERREVRYGSGWVAGLFVDNFFPLEEIIFLDFIEIENFNSCS